MILDAADFGAATHRPRVIVIGYDKNQMQPINESDLLNQKTKAIATVKEAIFDLPRPIKANGIVQPWRAYRKDAPPSAYAKQLKAIPTMTGLGAEEAIHHLKSGRVSGIQATTHSPHVQSRFRKLKSGERDSISKYVRLKWDQPAGVLRAGTGTDKGSYQAARPIHPTSPRVISVREAARLQGFPDWFQFDPTIWHSHRMIGNSVSPIFARAIFEVIGNKIN